MVPTDQYTRDRNFFNQLSDAVQFPPYGQTRWTQNPKIGLKSLVFFKSGLTFICNTFSAFAGSTSFNENDGDVEIIEIVKQQGKFMSKTILDLTGKIDCFRRFTELLFMQSGGITIF